MMFVWFMILCRPKQFLLGPIMARLMLRDLLRWHQATFIKSSYKQDPFQIASHTSLTTAFNQCLLQLLKNVLLTWIQRLENKLKDKWFAKPLCPLSYNAKKCHHIIIAFMHWRQTSLWIFFLHPVSIKHTFSILIFHAYNYQVS